MTIARIMKVCASSRAWRISVVCLVFALLLGTGVQIFAGEPIVFGNSKRQTEPNSEKVPARNPFGFEKLSAPVPFEGILPPVLPSFPSNARKDKRQQNADDETRN